MTRATMNAARYGFRQRLSVGQVFAIGVPALCGVIQGSAPHL